MKEGYLQNKIRELDYKLKQQMELAEYLEKQLQMVIDTKKDYKALFNKLKDLDKFKESILKEIAKKNKIEIKSIINESNELINKNIQNKIEKSNEKLKIYLEKELSKYKNMLENKELILKNSNKINFNEQLNNILLEELANERVLTNERIEILKKRASIRAKDEK